MVARWNYLRCFVGLSFGGRWPRISGKEENTVHRRDPLLRYGGPVVVFGSWTCQADSLRGFSCIS